jgi:polyisoprenyl-phosphate glycosyltransferase
VDGHQTEREQIGAAEIARDDSRQPAGRPSSWKLSVIIPVFNEERGITALLSRLKPVLDATGAAYEVVFVDDGSSDSTLSQLRAANNDDPRIKTISLSRNFGKEIAVTAGLRTATGDATILMDADLQHPPEVIPKLIAGWLEGHDIVYGARLDRDADSQLRRAFSLSYYTLFRALSGTKLHENGGDFRLFSRRALTAFNQLGERARFNKGLYAWIGFSVLAVPFDVPDRADGGGSKWSLRRLARFAIDGLASFSTLPLRVWSILGLAVSLFAFGYIIVFLIKTLIFGNETAGFPTLIISIMFFAGVQLISLGVMGEYLGRIYDEVKGRPLYLIADRIGDVAHLASESTMTKPHV